MIVFSHIVSYVNLKCTCMSPKIFFDMWKGHIIIAPKFKEKGSSSNEIMLHKI